MKLNKSLILSALVASSCLTGASALQAQDTNSAATPPASDAPKPMRARPAGFDMIAKQLDLTDDQKAQIKHIRWTVTDREDRRKQILAVLTPEQKAKLKQMIREHRNGGEAAPAST